MSKLCNKFRELSSLLFPHAGIVQALAGIPTLALSFRLHRYCDLYRDLEEEEEAAGVAAGNQENEGESSQKKKYRAPRDLSPEQLAALSKVGSQWSLLYSLHCKREEGHYLKCTSPSWYVSVVCDAA